MCIRDRNTSDHDTRLIKCFICDKVGHKSVDYKARLQLNSKVRSDQIRCYKCLAYGHKAFACPACRNSEVQKAAAVKVIPEELTTTVETRSEMQLNHEHVCDAHNVNEHVKLACGCIMSVLAGARFANDRVQFERPRASLTPICRGRINDGEVDVVTFLRPCQFRQPRTSIVASMSGYLDVNLDERYVTRPRLEASTAVPRRRSSATVTGCV